MIPSDQYDNDQDRIAAYLDGELDAAAASDFERRLAREDELRDEVETWRAAREAAREWFEAEAPGADRVDALALPQAIRVRAEATKATEGTEGTEPAATARVIALGHSGRARRPGRPARRGRTYLWQGLAAAAIFVVGVLIGQLGSRPNAPSTIPGQHVGVQDRAPGAVPPAAAPQVAATPAPETVPETAPVHVQPAAGADKDLAALEAPAVTSREENGRLIIETTRPETGARATWVVDGGFKVAGLAKDR